MADQITDQIIDGKTKTETMDGSHESETKAVLYELFHNKTALIGIVILGLLLFVVIFADMIAPYDPMERNVGPSLAPPGTEHLLGTDQLGRDSFSRIVHGSRITLRVGFTAVGISLSFGLIIGIVAVYGGGIIEKVLMRFVDVVFSFTQTLIALAIVAVLGPSITNTTIAIGISFMPWYARVTYGATLEERNKPYVEANRAIGAGSMRIIFVHILPNVLAPVIVVATLGISTAILEAAALSFLGLGAQPPMPEWGLIISSNRGLISLAPWLMVFPGLAIAITVLGFNLLGEGLREALDPRQRKR